MTEAMDKLHRENRQLQSALRNARRTLAMALSADCRTCGGEGSVDGFLLGTIKRCPACDGTGVRGHRD